MALTHKQKKYINKKIGHFSPEKIARDIGVTAEEICAYVGNDKKMNNEYLIVNNGNKKNNNESGIKTNTLNLNLSALVKKYWWGFLLLAVLAFAAFANSLPNAGVSDDIPGMKNLAITKIGMLLGDPTNFFGNMKSYLMYLVLGNSNPMPYRLANILFHIGNTWLVYLLGMAFLRKKSSALAAAAIFAVHPILTESVTWITGGIYGQYAFFILLTVLFYLKGLADKKFYYLSFLTAFIALTTVNKAIVLPFVLAVVHIYAGKRRNWRRLVPYFAITLVFVLFLAFHIGSRLTVLQQNYYAEKGTNNPFYYIPIAIANYLALFLWPDKLSLYQSELNYSAGLYLVCLSIFLTVIAWGLYSLKNRRFAFMCLGIFFISLGPTLTPFKIASVVAERYVYLGTAALALLTGYILDAATEDKRKAAAVWLITELFIIGLMVRTYARNQDWKNEDALWLAADRTSPTSIQNHNNLGDYYIRHDDLVNSEKEFRTAIFLNPNYGDAFHNLGNVYSKANRFDIAAEAYKRAIKINPNIWQSHLNLGAIYYNSGMMDEAKAEMDKALKLNPSDAGLFYNAGLIFSKSGDKIKAKEYFEKALALDPSNTEMRKSVEQLLK